MVDESDSLQQQLDEQKEAGPAKFGTFAGVFRPTVMTIVGVIMFVREGWVVGNAGLLEALDEIGESFRDEGVYARETTAEEIRTGVDTLTGTLFRPNFLFMRDSGHENALA